MPYPRTSPQRQPSRRPSPRRDRPRTGGRVWPRQPWGWLASGLLLLALLAVLSPQLLTPNAPAIAQAPTPIQPSAAQVIQVNGRTTPGSWLRTSDDRVFVADMALTQATGVQLLSNSRPTLQPLQWFSNVAPDPLQSAAQIVGSKRYLDVQDITNRFGWQVRPQGQQLTIQTPAANIASIRQGRQPWGDRLVVDLDQPTPWSVSEQRGAVVITVDAQLNPANQPWRGRSGQYITAVQAQPQGNRTVLQISLPATLRPYLWTLPNPNRLVIDIRPDGWPEKTIQWADGLTWQQRWLTLGAKAFPTTVLTVDPRRPQIQVRSLRSSMGQSTGITSLVDLARYWDAAAAINGGFFNRNNQLPLGALRQDGRWQSGPILSRGAIAWNDQGSVALDRLTVQTTLTTNRNQTFPIVVENSGYVQAGVARYTPDWGAEYVTLTDTETVVTVQGDRVVDQRQITGTGQRVAIPPDGMLLIVRSYATAAAALTPGTTLTVAARTNPSHFDAYPHVMGAGPLLVQRGQIVVNGAQEQFSPAFNSQAASRSAIGLKPDGTLILVAVHNRGSQPGPTLPEMARLMTQLGATDALNLDGGSSTSLYLGGTLVDRSPQTAARISNAIGIFIRPTP